MENNILKSSNHKIILVLVGLPARGKSFTSNRLANYLNWCGVSCKVFNAGEYRRRLMLGFQDNSFFDSKNEKSMNKKEEIFSICFSELIEWLGNGGDIGILDATNTTKERRKLITCVVEDYKHKINIRPVFLELITNNDDIINRNLTLKMQSPDYIDKKPDFALNDFKKRLELYNEIYQTIDDDEELSYIKKYNFDDKICLKNVSGICESLVVSYLINLKIVNKPIYISRHGQSVFNTLNKLGGDSGLTEKGEHYSTLLGQYIIDELGHEGNYYVFTSCLKRTIDTAKHIPTENKSTRKKIVSRLLNEIHAGICENMTVSEIEEKHPDIIKQRNDNKLCYRYPEGESYLDLIERLQHFILQILSIDKPIIIVAHQAINRVLLGYFLGINKENLPYEKINLNEVIKLVPNDKGYRKEIIKLY